MIYWSACCVRYSGIFVWVDILLTVTYWRHKASLNLEYTASVIDSSAIWPEGITWNTAELFQLHLYKHKSIEFESQYISFSIKELQLAGKVSSV